MEGRPEKTLCQRVSNTEAWLADGASAVDPETGSHIDNCPDCRQILQDHRLLRELRTLLGDTSPQSDRPSGSWELPGYLELTELQRGGQGVVFRAVHEQTRRPVAIKLLLGGAFATPRQRDRFRREIELAARLRHPNVVTIYDSGEHDGHAYCVMQFVNGRPLNEHSSQLRDSLSGRKLDRRLAELCRRVAAAVGHAHTHGIMHRDLKPANILVDSAGEPHVLDFGLARSGQAEGATRSGEFLGTLRYASPEQAAAEPTAIDIRTDVYSLGMMFYEVWTGEVPYDTGDTIDRVIVNIRDATPVPPSKHNPRIDPELETILLKAIAKPKERRYQSGDEFARDLGRFLAGEPIDAKRDSPLYVAGKLIRRYRYAVAVAGLVFAIVVASLVVSVALLRQAERDRDAATAARKDADLARRGEKQRRLEVEQQRTTAEFNAYVSSLAATDAALTGGDTAEARLHLNRAPVARRAFEWWHLRNRIDESRSVFHGHTSYVEQVLALETRPWIVSIGWDKRLIIRNRLTGEQLAVRELKDFGWTIAANPKEDRLAVGVWDGTVMLLTLPGLEEVASLRGRARRVASVAFSEDGNRVAAAFWRFDNDAEQNEVVVAHAADGRTIFRRSFPAPPTRVVFDRTDDSLLCVSNRETTQLNARGEPLKNSSALVLAVGAAGQSLTHEPGSHVVDVRDASGVVVTQFKGHEETIYSAAFSPDGHFAVTGSDDQTVRVWNARTGAAIRSFRGHQWRVTSVGFVGETGHVVSASWDQTVRIWDPRGPRAIEVLPAHKAAVNVLTVSEKHDVIASGAADGSVQIRRLSDLTLLHEFRDHRRPVQDIAFSDDGSRIATASWDRTAVIRTLTSESEPTVLRGHTDLVLTVRFVPAQPRVLTGSRDNTIRVWNTRTGELLRVLGGHDDHIHSIRFNGDATRFASSGHKSIRVWNTSDLSQHVRIERQIIREDYSLAWEPRTQHIVAGNQRSIAVWSAETGAPMKSVLAARDELRTIHFDGSGSRLVSVSVDGTTRVWEPDHPTALLTLRNPDKDSLVRTAVFTPNGNRVIGGRNDGSLVLWKQGPVAQE